MSLFDFEVRLLKFWPIWCLAAFVIVLLRVCIVLLNRLGFLLAWWQYAALRAYAKLAWLQNFLAEHVWEPLMDAGYEWLAMNPVGWLEECVHYCIVIAETNLEFHEMTILYLSSCQDRYKSRSQRDPDLGPGSSSLSC